MNKSQQKSFFICTSCKLKQNIDQSVHISKNYCVRCYNKEQIYQDMIQKFNFYQRILKEKGDLTPIRKKKLKELIRLNEILLPQTIFELEDGEIISNLKEMQKNAIKTGMKELEKKYGLNINDDAITYELIDKLRPIWESSQKISKNKITYYLEQLEPFIDKKIENIPKFFKDLRSSCHIPYFTKTNKGYCIKYMRPFPFNQNFLLKTVKTYRKRILFYTDQKHQFQYFVEKIGQICQFQTVNDALKQAIEIYVKEIASEAMQRFADRMMEEINIREKSNLIPNIAKYIMDNHEVIFETWYTKILPFDKSRFMASQARTGSRTDFVVRLQYKFRHYELKMIMESLKSTTELMIKEKAKSKLKKIQNDKSLSEEKRLLKIKRINERLQNDLLPENLERIQIQNMNSAPMVARLLLLNAEKAFNLILNQIIRYHYRRLNISTPVQYITNVLESGAEEIRRDLKAFYFIHSREW
ncbi:MAG: hypothetical protein K9W44_16100 [Candidatus Lokiarchaeota archaeon]|nr:hypothetical protein [Candidatus Harpocratesius repetitus]